MIHPLLGIDYATSGARADVLRSHPLYGAFQRWQRQHFSGRFDPDDQHDRMLFEAFVCGAQHAARGIVDSAVAEHSKQVSKFVSSKLKV